MQGSLQNRWQPSTKSHTRYPLAGVWHARSFQREEDSSEAALTVACSELGTASQQQADATPLPGAHGVMFAAFAEGRLQPARGREAAWLGRPSRELRPSVAFLETLMRRSRAPWQRAMTC